MHFVMYVFSSCVEVLHNVTPIDFDICDVFNDHNIWILQKVTPLDLLAQVAGPLGDNRWFYLTGWFWRACIISTAPHHPIMQTIRAGLLKKYSMNRYTKCKAFS